MGEDQCQPRSIFGYLEYRLTHHRISRCDPGRQRYTGDPGRLLPPAPLRVYQIRPDQLLALGTASCVVGDSDRDADESAAVMDEKSGNLLDASYGKAHLVVALVLPNGHSLLGLQQRNPHQYSEIDRPHACDPGQMAEGLRSLSLYQRNCHADGSNRGPAHQCDQ